MSSPSGQWPSSEHPYLLISAGGQVQVVIPAHLLVDQGPQAVLDELMAKYPPSPPQQQQQNDLFTNEELDAMADWASSPAAPFPLDDEQFTSSPPPAPAAPAPAPALAPATPTPAPALAPPAPRQPAPRRGRGNKTTPPGFPGYRWVAQTVALQASPRRPQVQLGHIYAYMQKAWPEHFRSSGAGAGGWKSGVRHAVLKHFKRVSAPRGEKGVWYEPDPDNVMTAEEARRIVRAAGGGVGGGGEN
ncbi:uncharacterized protein LTHEOB_6048 [Lasiodiplodia theobromae]|uniref:Fork-head domain-containing protein n=1 Tax=Lasiodiplodia theobromae TaxID=45133 RepID=A0A5N5D6I8_9PEZI|nr:uncharacterized protein LTHEOB_6048 [Lasiodiplodia theobromae]KAB2573022.1 hypothetical protein DBV05_g8325 [Lasiodiplodia theobromae]KAF4544478.1 hypothetical protein LTHEOB_6048 [Lasiodiplodia theobromae]